MIMHYQTLVKIGKVTVRPGDTISEIIDKGGCF